MAQRNHAAVCVVKWQKNGSKLHGLHMLRQQDKGGLQMVDSCCAFLVIVLLGIFAAGSSEIVSERAERRRIEREVRKKYGRTY